ncbi:MAG: gliding motility-associated C-terminal domain-containing protein [Bacteroidales bacterium]|nr:gliding motility-associated C-terminal domain-containing protein [Bacteroidales bacterium]
MRRLLAIITLLLILPNIGWGQVLTTSGRDFWVAFPINHSGGTMSLIISGNEAATGLVTDRLGSWSQSFTVTPGQVTTVDIPYTFEFPTAETVRDNGLHVTTTKDVSLYASNYSYASYDITNVLPTNALQSRYVLQSVDSCTFENEFCVVATQNNTLVYIDMPVNSSLSSYGLGNGDGRFRAGVTDSVLLQRGQAYLVKAFGDISGTMVWTESCKPVAVFVGNVCANVPCGCTYCDHIYEQAIPVEYWGRRFGITTSMTRTSDILKITALNDNTQVTYLGNTFTLQARESRTLDISPTDDTAFYLEGSQPLSVFLYLKGSSCAGTNGDPSYTVIHPIEQQVSSITFATFNTGLSQSHYVNMVTLSQYADNIYLDNQMLNPNIFRPLPGNADYKYARIEVTGGSHTLSSPLGGFVAHVYGLGLAESYSYAVGTSLDPINPQPYLNNNPFAMYDSTNNMFCNYDTLNFSVEVVNAESTVVQWDFGDGSGAVGMSASHAYLEPGDYTISVQCAFLEPICWKITNYVLTIPIRILSQASSVLDTVVCDSVCVWNGYRYDTVGLYSKYYETGALCDSVAYLNLQQMYLPPHPAIEYNYDCHSQQCQLHALGNGDYLLWSSVPHNPEIDGHEGDPILLVTTDQTRSYRLYMAYTFDSLCGSDTVLRLPAVGEVVAEPKANRNVVDYDNTLVRLSDEGHGATRFVWYAADGEIGRSQRVDYDYPIQYDSVIVTLAASNEYDCHDTATLTLYMQQNSLYVPNIITPALRTNNVFEVQGVSILDGEIWIFNREGLLLWHTDNIRDTWDATKDGTPLPQGTYVYAIRYRKTFESNVWLRKMGTVTVVR